MAYRSREAIEPSANDGALLLWPLRRQVAYGHRGATEPRAIDRALSPKWSTRVRPPRAARTIFVYHKTRALRRRGKVCEASPTP